MLKLIWNRLRSFRYISMPLFLMQPTAESYEITHERKFWTHEKSFEPTKYPREKILDPWNTHEKIASTHNIRKNFGATKYLPEKNSDPRNIHEKIFRTHKMPKTKYFRPTKYPTRHEGKRSGTRPTRSAMACDPRNLTHSKLHSLWWEKPAL